MLEASGVPFTSLRNGFYAESALMLAGQFLETSQVIAPEDGPVSWTTHADLAEAAAIALTQEGKLDGLTPPLTASKALDLAALAAMASELIGREITRVTISDADYRMKLISSGAPEWRADLAVGLFAASRQGEFAAVDPALEHLLGRPPVPMQTVLASQRSSRQAQAGTSK
jgi:NAD(P)H dehydrogenase (quinone)